MASINITQGSEGSFTFNIYGETEYTLAKRDIAYDLNYVDGGNYGIYMAQMDIGETDGAEVTVYDLEPGVTYTVRAEIRTNTVLVLETEQISFTVPKEIEAFNIEQTAAGEKSIKVTWNDASWKGAAYYIYAAQITAGETSEFYEKASGVCSADNTVIISVDKFCEYMVRLKLVLNDKTEYTEKRIELDSGVYMAKPTNLRIIREYPVPPEPIFNVIWDNVNPEGYYLVWTGGLYAYRVRYSYAENGDLPVQLNNATYINDYLYTPLLKYGQRYAIYACQYEPDNPDVSSDDAVTYAYTNPQSPTLTISAETPGKLVISWGFDTTSPNYKAISYDSIMINIIKQNGNAYNRAYNFERDYNDNTVELTLPAGDYTILAFTTLYDSDNGENLTSSDTVENVTVNAAKPEPFEWNTPKNKGEQFSIGADEWNGFFDRINQTRVYKGMSEYVYTPAKTGSEFKSTMYNQTRQAIQEMGDSAGSYIYDVEPGDCITGYDTDESPGNVNVIVNELNAVINYL